MTRCYCLACGNKIIFMGGSQCYECKRKSCWSCMVKVRKYSTVEDYCLFCAKEEINEKVRNFGDGEICSDCGKRGKRDDIFCSGCGNKLGKLGMKKIGKISKNK